MSQAATTLVLLDRAHEAVLLASSAESATARHRGAQLAASRAAAALVSARTAGTRPGSRQGVRSGGGPVDVWELTARLAPELAEWSRHFAVMTRRGSLVDSGRVRVSVREADDLLRDAEGFLERAEQVLGLPPRHEPARLAPVRSA